MFKTPKAPTTFSCPRTPRGATSSWRIRREYSPSTRSRWNSPRRTLRPRSRSDAYMMSEILLVYEYPRSLPLTASFFGNPPPYPVRVDIRQVSSQDCAEVYRVGATAPDWYELDTSGQNRTTDDPEVYCEEGWTYILTRNSATNHLREVNSLSKYVPHSF